LFLKPISKFAFHIGPLKGVIPAKAEIQVFYGLKWPSAYAGVTDSLPDYLL